MQKQSIRSYGKRDIPLSIAGHCEEMSASVEFDVADVAYSALGLRGAHCEGLHNAFGEHESYMATDWVRA